MKSLVARALVAAAAVAIAAPAQAAETIGNTTVPSGGSVTGCDAGVIYVASSDDASPVYQVPTGGGALTAWQMYTPVSYPDISATLLVLRPGSSERTFTVVGRDTESLPSTLPSNFVVSFPITSPIQTQAGDILGLYWPSPTGLCVITSTTLTSSLVLESDTGTPAPTPVPGEAITTPDTTPLDYELDLSATLDNDLDAGVATSTGPAGATVGSPTELTSSVTSAGPATAPITVTDSVPAGLTIDAAIAADGSCTTAGQVVSCTITGLAPGQSAPVDVIVTPTAAGTFVHTVSVGTGGFTDPTPADNAAGGALTVTLAPTPGQTRSRCHVPPLTKTPSAVANSVLKLLGCAVGKTTRAFSKKVGKGLVVKSTPKAGATLAAGKKVKLLVSRGPPKKRHRKQRHREAAPGVVDTLPGP